MPAPVHLFYETSGNREYCLSFGLDDSARNILIIPPLFDEMNRTRRMIVQAMRHLAQRGVRSMLLDLPGYNESEAALPLQSIASWTVAVSNAACQLGATHLASIRGGCLLDDVGGLPRWRLAPVKGAAILKTLLRTRLAAEKEAGVCTSADQLLADGLQHGIDLAGHKLGAQMLSGLEDSFPAVGDNITEDVMAGVAGTPLWLRAEPRESPAMSAALAARLDAWSASCGE